MRNIIEKFHLAAWQKSFLFLRATAFFKTLGRACVRRTQTKFWMSVYLTL